MHLVMAVTGEDLVAATTGDLVLVALLTRAGAGVLSAASVALSAVGDLCAEHGDAGIGLAALLLSDIGVEVGDCVQAGALSGVASLHAFSESVLSLSSALSSFEAGDTLEAGVTLAMVSPAMTEQSAHSHPAFLMHLMAVAS